VIATATIVARNYLPHARVLSNSFRHHHPDIPFFVLIVDGEPDDFAQIGLRDVFQPPHNFSLKQRAVAAKPFLLQHLLDRGFDRCLFIDPDMLVLAPLTALLEHVEQHSVVLTPHLVTPPRDEQRIAREQNILLSGVYNGGLIGISDRPPAREFLKWWGDRVLEECENDVARGVYYDQRWLDLAPVFFRDVSILRDPAYNVAYWNLPERDLDNVALFHFSGFDPSKPERMTRYAPELTAGPFFTRYATLLREAGYR